MMDSRTWQATKAKECPIDTSVVYKVNNAFGKTEKNSFPTKLFLSILFTYFLSIGKK
jgi:hypothetical protein